MSSNSQIPPRNGTHRPSQAQNWTPGIMAKRSATTPRSEVPIFFFSKVDEPDVKKQFEEIPEGHSFAIAPHVASICNGVFFAVNQMCKVEGKINGQGQHNIELVENQAHYVLDDLIREVFKRLGSTKFYDLKVSGTQQCDSTVAYIPLMMCLYLIADHYQDTVVPRSSMSLIADDVLKTFGIKLASPLAIVQAINQGSLRKAYVVPKEESNEVASHDITRLFKKTTLFFLKTNLHPSTTKESIHPNPRELEQVEKYWSEIGIRDTISRYSKNHRHKSRWTDLQKDCNRALNQCVKKGTPIIGFEPVKGGVLIFIPNIRSPTELTNLFREISLQIAHTCEESVNSITFNELERSGAARLVDDTNASQDEEYPIRTYEIEWKAVVPKKKSKTNSK